MIDLSYGDIAEMTAKERVALPAKYHRPFFDSLGVPHSWLCEVCWDSENAWVTAWPCNPAIDGGLELADELGLKASR